MRNYSPLAFAGLAFCMVLAACHDNGTIVPTAPPTSSSVDFETFARDLVQVNTCDTTAPAETNGIDFSYLSDQDLAEPRDVSALVKACSST